MAQHTRSMWHIPKRASIHQIIGALNILHKYGLEEKKWPALTRKKFNQKLAMWGFTDRGRSLSRTASETLEALLKYLGLIYIRPYDNVLIITDAGKKLIKEHPVSEPKKEKRKLRETISEMGDVTSDAIRLQMLKLVLTNPLVKRYCKGIHVAPFRETLQLLLDKEVNHLTAEEMGYLLFFMKSTKDRNAIKKNILQFRKLSEAKRKRKIENYLKTPEGNLTLKQAPTTSYWIQLCKNTGLCEISNGSLSVVPSKTTEARKYLAKFSDDVATFDSLEMWMEYIGKPNRLEYPIKVDFSFSNVDRKGTLITIKQGGKIVDLEGVGVNLIVDGVKSLRVPLFPHEDYKIEVRDISTMQTLHTQDLVIKAQSRIKIELPRRKKIEEKFSKRRIVENIKQMIIDGKTLDDEYEERIRNLAVPLGLVSSRTEIDRYIKRRRISLRGGRLEFLIHCFLRILKKEGVIRKLGKWRGKMEKGVYLPAPGGNFPDVSFELDDLVIGLEITSATGRLQWKTEAESVTDHIVWFKKHIEKKSRKKVVGVFTAPKIEEFMKAVCIYIGTKEGTTILCYPTMDLLNALNQTSSKLAMKNLLSKHMQGFK